MKPQFENKITLADWLKEANAKIGTGRKRNSVHGFTESDFNQERKDIPGLSTSQIRARMKMTRVLTRTETDPVTRARLTRLRRMYRNVLEIREG